MNHKESCDSDPLLGENTYTSYIRSSSWSGASDLHDSEEEIKQKLQWYFKNPYGKYKDRGRKPWKFILQILKLVLVTTQAIMFAVDEFSVVAFNNGNIATFRHIFLKDFTASQPFRELYTKKEVYSHMFYTWKQYYNFEHIMIGAYGLKDFNQTYRPINLCKHYHSMAKDLDLYNKAVRSNTDDYCHDLKPPKISANLTKLPEFIEENKLPTNFEWILTLTMRFSFQMNYTVLHKKNSPDCYEFDIKILFDNSDLDGIMSVDLDSIVNFHHCRENTNLHIIEHVLHKELFTLFDCIIIVVCFISFCLCIRSFVRHFKVCKEAIQFFKDYRHEDFTFSDKMNFLSFWLVLITLSDIFTMAGSVVKIILDWSEYPELYDVCSLSFGLAVLFSWIGILRYLGFMKGYNTLLITLKTAFPTIIRFIFCVAFIYLGFTVCGWIVFGPYHEKFRDLSITSECLFALINGDDMFATFSEMDDSDKLVWYFSKIYLYIFISLFIFVVLSLFIGIMADTYERISDYGHPPKTRVELFMEGKEYHEGIPQQHRHGTMICNHKCEDEADLHGLLDS